MRALLFCMLISVSGFCQTPGKSLVCNTVGERVDFGEVLEDVRTISFWMKLTAPIDNMHPLESPILVRDGNDPQSFSSGQFAIYFGKTGTPEAGRLVFLRADLNADFWVVSDKNTWAADEWFHAAFVLHPTLGMQMYINGILQQSTQSSTVPIYFRQEGNTGSVYLGRWGEVNGYGLKAEIDELRFYATAKSELEIRNTMCSVEAYTGSNLKAYFNFDNSTTTSMVSVVGSAIGIPANFKNSSFISSNAPVGDVSIQEYGLNGNTSLTLLQPVEFTVDDLNTSAEGMHLYYTNDATIFAPGVLATFFGVWFTKSSATYQAKLDYSVLNVTCDSCNEIETRDMQTDGWVKRTDKAVNCQLLFPNESPGVLDFREEYKLTYEIQLKSGLDEVITQCEGYDVFMAATSFPGAKFLWDNGETNNVRQVDTPGFYWVNIKWNGCEITDTVEVVYEESPFFELPNDTSICVGDTLILEGPMLDSATYSWGYGLAFGRTYRMYAAGTMTLTVTLGNCKWTDEINVKVIRNFPLNLGPDTTLCLGEELVIKAPEGVDYLWNTGASAGDVYVFNQPQKIWIQAWNQCFTKYDTITIDYEECDCHFYMANSFTPNNDGVNDIFVPVTGCIFEEYELMIFDRWGAKVFYSTDPDQSWDGTRNGKPLPQGVYNYQVRYKKYTDYKVGNYKRGMITLMK